MKGFDLKLKELEKNIKDYPEKLESYLKEYVEVLLEKSGFNPVLGKRVTKVGKNLFQIGKPMSFGNAQENFRHIKEAFAVKVQEGILVHVPPIEDSNGETITGTDKYYLVVHYKENNKYFTCCLANKP